MKNIDTIEPIFHISNKNKKSIQEIEKNFL